MNVAVLDRPSGDWDAYVTAQGSSPYLESGWALLAARVFRLKAYFLELRDAGGTLRGVLPLVLQRSLVFGDFATSLPFFNYGGALADEEAVRLQLMQRARELAHSLGCKYLELRDAAPAAGDWQLRTDKITMERKLPATVDLLGKELGSKLRSQTRRADRENASVVVGTLELLDEFYEVFCANMRDLGTPVYPRRFFAALLDTFPARCTLLVIRRGGVAAAAGFLIQSGSRMEIPWAACRSQDKPAGFNMKLYWEVLSLAIARGCELFDFGRSTADSSTYKFKTQWGAQPRQLYWHRWEKGVVQGAAESGARGQGKALALATQVWRRMPLALANRLGPLISPSLPW